MKRDKQAILKRAIELLNEGVPLKYVPIRLNESPDYINQITRSYRQTGVVEDKNFQLEWPPFPKFDNFASWLRVQRFNRSSDFNVREG